MLKNLKLKKVYSSEYDSPVEDFYIPVLSEAISYKRVTGFFSSSSLFFAARGIAQFVTNGGKIKLLTGVILSDEDYKAFLEGDRASEELLAKYIHFDVHSLKDEIELDHLQVLSWLIASQRLEIKIALMPEKNTGIFHEKVGIFRDSDGNKVSFSGSINETGAGWINNIEEFKVFRSWVEEERGYLERDSEKFHDYWENNTKNFKAIDLPAAIKENLLAIKPDDEKIKILVEAIKQKKITKKEIKLFDYQEEAIKSWFDNNKIGIFEMATGTGKTITALGVVRELLKKNGAYCVVISVPYKHLATQWSKDVSGMLPNAEITEAHSDSKNWKLKVGEQLRDYCDGIISELAIITSYATLSSEGFRSILNSFMCANREYILIADEMHNLGAPQYGKGMMPMFAMRIGLSATPVRAYDEIGTASLVKYFDKTVIRYDLKEAIKNGRLTKYDYFPIFVTLTKEEFDEYVSLSKKILRQSRSKENNLNDDYLRILLLNRSKVIKNSQDKIKKFNALVGILKEKNMIDHLLVYCDSGGQLKIAQEVINENGILNHKFTQEETLNEREQILDNFDNGIYDCLVAIKCLDEGVNVPSTKTAIILASSSNPREYIQRRGRVLRKYPGKDKAIIYDFVVLPPEEVMKTELGNIEKQLLKKEMNRVQEFLDSADNRAFVFNTFSDKMIEYGVYLD